MNFIIFAGGIGTRLWPLSRENAPKQFDKLFFGKSTLELAIDRVAPVFGHEHIFIQTTDNFRPMIIEQASALPADNIIIEPARRNLGPAVALAVMELIKRGRTGPLAILWADHLMERPEAFTAALRAGEEIIKSDGDRFVFLAEKPRFANNNLGWINIGERAGSCQGLDYYAFAGWKYKPAAGECEQMFKSGHYAWNPGYFITSLEFLRACYEKLAPDIWSKVKNGPYTEAEATHFDRAIIEKLSHNQAVVIKTDMGWSDPGTLYALKEAMQESPDANVTMGETIYYDTADTLLVNHDSGKLLAAVGLEGMVVVNTPDAIVVAAKDKVVNITDLVKKIRAEGLEKYL